MFHNSEQVFLLPFSPPDLSHQCPPISPVVPGHQFSSVCKGASTFKSFPDRFWFKLPFSSRIYTQKHQMSHLLNIFCSMDTEILNKCIKKQASQLSDTRKFGCSSLKILFQTVESNFHLLYTQKKSVFPSIIYGHHSCVYKDLSRKLQPVEGFSVTVDN